MLDFNDKLIKIREYVDEMEEDYENVVGDKDAAEEECDRQHDIILDLEEQIEKLEVENGKLQEELNEKN